MGYGKAGKSETACACEMIWSGLGKGFHNEKCLCLSTQILSSRLWTPEKKLVNNS